MNKIITSSRATVYDYTANKEGITNPHLDPVVFSREGILSKYPVNLESLPNPNSPNSKIGFILSTISVYQDFGIEEIFDLVKRESLLGQAIVNVIKDNMIRMGDKHHWITRRDEIAYEFDRLVKIYRAAGYNTSGLDDFAAELIEMYSRRR